MGITETVVGESSNSGKGVKRGREEGVNHVHYTEQQIEVLKKVYAESTAPRHFQQSKIMPEQPSLTGIDNTQSNVWFENCSVSRLLTGLTSGCPEQLDREIRENKKLIGANRQLQEENDYLHKKLTSTTAAADLGRVPEANSSQLSFGIADRNSRIISLAEETRNEFISKVIGTAIDWVPIQKEKLHVPSSVSDVSVSRTCTGVAARAFTTVPFDPIKMIEILKDKSSWSRDCRKLEVLAEYPLANGGLIELVYTQYYAPTTLACARDFWTLRYSSVLDDGSFAVCEKSVSSSDAVPSSPVTLEFVRGRMLASGYLIRWCQEGSTVCLVHHLDLEASSVPAMLQSLYESSEFVAEKMIFPALNYIQYLANATSGKYTHVSGEDPAFLRSFSQRLWRGFNDAISGFSEDGWSLMNADVSDDVIISIKGINNFGVTTDYDSVICVKASLVLQNVFVESLVKFLKDHRAAWMNFNFDDHFAAFSGSASFPFPGLKSHRLSETAVPLGRTNHGEILEVIRFERITHHRLNVSSGDLYHVQIYNGGFGVGSELIFAPIDKSMPKDAILLASGFRIFSLGPNTSDGQGTWSSANLISNKASNPSNVQLAISHPCSMLILAFQFPSKIHLQEDVVAIACKYVQHVISSIKSIYPGAMPSRSSPGMNSTEANSNPGFGAKITPDLICPANLASCIVHSYRSNIGVDFLSFNSQNTEYLLELMQYHQYAILCFSFTSIPVCLYANQAGLIMLETTVDNLQSITVDKILGDSNCGILYSVIPTIIQQGYAMLPYGCCMSLMHRCISYEGAVVWKVQNQDGSVHSLALAFINWSFIRT